MRRPPARRRPDVAVIAVRLCLVALGLDLVAKHLEAVEAGVVDLARLALGAEVAVAARQVVDDAVEARVALVGRLPTCTTSTQG